MKRGEGFSESQTSGGVSCSCSSTSSSTIWWGKLNCVRPCSRCRSGNRCGDPDTECDSDDVCGCCCCCCDSNAKGRERWLWFVFIREVNEDDKTDRAVVVVVVVVLVVIGLALVGIDRGPKSFWLLLRLLVGRWETITGLNGFLRLSPPLS